MSKCNEYESTYIAENHELKRKNAELEDMVKCLQSDNKRLNELEEKLRSQLANAFHKIGTAGNGSKEEIDSLKKQVEELNRRRKKDKKELKKMKKLLFEQNQRYQEDCITINRLNTTIDVLTERIAAMRSGR
jgi:chromosome segregation ATPase